VERIELAGDPGITPETILLLLHDSKWSVRQAAVMNPSIPQRLLEQVVRGDDLDQRFWAAANPNIPKDLLELLSVDEDPGVCMMA